LGLTAVAFILPVLLLLSWFLGAIAVFYIEKHFCPAPFMGLQV